MGKKWRAKAIHPTLGDHGIVKKRGRNPYLIVSAVEVSTEPLCPFQMSFFKSMRVPEGSNARRLCSWASNKCQQSDMVSPGAGVDCSWRIGISERRFGLGGISSPAKTGNWRTSGGARAISGGREFVSAVAMRAPAQRR